MRFLFALVMLTGSCAFAASKSLEKELKDLDVQDAVPASRLEERLYAVQGRATPLLERWEVLVSAAQSFSTGNFLESSQFGAEGQYHFTDRFSVAGAYSRVANRFNSSADNLQAQTGYLPDVDFAKSRLEARAQYSLFYGKFRFTRAQAMSFDQYWGAGLARNELRSGNVVGPVFDAGFAFYIGQKFTFHLGVKDYYYEENRTLSKGITNNVHGYVQAGLLL